MTRMIAVLIPVALMSMACRPSETPAEALQELATTRAGSVEVVLLSADSTLHTRSTVIVEFRDASTGRLVDVGTVTASATMPMAGMAPMMGSVEVQPSSVTGRYAVMTELEMAGEWRLALEWSGPSGSGSAGFSQMFQ